MNTKEVGDGNNDFEILLLTERKMLTQKIGAKTSFLIRSKLRSSKIDSQNADAQSPTDGLN